MAKKQKEISKNKIIKKKLRKAFKPRNIGQVLVVLATIALLATSILPYLL